MSFFDGQEALARQMAASPLGLCARAAVDKLDAHRGIGDDMVIWTDGRRWTVEDRPGRFRAAVAQVLFWLWVRSAR